MPAKPAAGPPDPSRHAVDAREFVGIRAGHKDLFGGTTTWEDLRRDLSHYTLAEVLDILGRISAVLKAARHDDVSIQARVATGLLGRGAGDILERADRLRAAAGNPRVVLFEQLQLASLAKAALLLLPADETLRPTLEYGHLASALLRMTDLIGPTDLGPFDTIEGKRSWAKYLFASGVFYRGGSDIHELARFRLLFLDRHEDLASHRDYVDLPGVIEAATGLPINLFWLGLTVLQSQWLSLDTEKAATGSAFIDEETFFAANFHFSQAEQDLIVSVATADAVPLQEAIRAQFSLDNFKPYDLVPLAEKPLVRLGRRIYCSSVPLLLSKSTTGLYYLVANFLRQHDRDKFTRFLGVIFEEYVEGLLVRMFEPSAATFVRGADLQEAAAVVAASGSKSADLLVCVDGIALVVETKARFFSRAARVGERWEDLSSRLDDIYSRGARQIEGTIESCERGALLRFGIDPASVRAYVPLLVALDETPLTPQVYDLITPVRPDQGAGKTIPLQVLGVSELEALEGAAAARQLNVHALLGHKGSTGRQSKSLRNVVLQDPALCGFNAHSPLLRRVYEEAMADALRVLGVRRR